MLLLGRIFGWLLVLAGLGLLLPYVGAWAEAGRLLPIAVFDMWHGADEAMLAFMQRAVANRISDAMLSGWTSAVLIIVGGVFIFGCRRPARR